MKKLFTIGLLALALATTAEAKNVVKIKITTKNTKSQKTVLKLQDPVNCNAGMTSCGVPYMFCGSPGTAEEVSDAVRLAVWEFEDYYYCELGGI